MMNREMELSMDELEQVNGGRTCEVMPKGIVIPESPFAPLPCPFPGPFPEPMPRPIIPNEYDQFDCPFEIL